MTYQLQAPLLDACVLGIVAQEDSYGYTRPRRLEKWWTFRESTLYPVLRRLQKENLLETYDQPFQGRNRRYYRVTEAGKEKLNFYRDEWKEYRTRLMLTISGSTKEG